MLQIVAQHMPRYRWSQYYLSALHGGNLRGLPTPAGGRAPKVPKDLPEVSYPFHKNDGYDATAKKDSPLEYWTETLYEARNPREDRGPRGEAPHPHPPRGGLRPEERLGAHTLATHHLQRPRYREHTLSTRPRALLPAAPYIALQRRRHCS